MEEREIIPVLQVMGHPEKLRLRQAAHRVTLLYPGPVGEVLSREILTWEEFGYRLGGDKLIMRLVENVFGTKLPGEAEVMGNVE